MALVKNPYEGVNWGGDFRVISTSHYHYTGPEKVWELYNRGMRFFAMTAYYPSDGRYHPITDLVSDLPEDVLGTPNPEHHNSIGDSQHFLGLGSTFTSGNPHGVSPVGTNMSIFDAFGNVIDNLIYSDGGGVIIAHPSKVPLKRMLEYVDYHPKVIGMEIYNHTTMNPINGAYGLATELWDKILMTGRYFNGFGGIDWTGYDDGKWGLDSGRTILLADEWTNHSVLKAWQKGTSWTALDGNIVDITNIEATDHEVSITIDKPSTIKFITNGEVKQTTSGTTASYNVKPTDIYVRMEIYNGDEILWTQPIMYKDQEILEKEKRRKRIKKILLLS